MLARSVSRHAPAGIALLLLAVLAAGCGGQGSVLARVGDNDITLDDFLAAARTSHAQYPGPPDSAKALLLEDLVRRELLVQAARRLGLERDSIFVNYRRRVEEQLLRERLFEKLAGGQPAVSDGEVEEFYRERDHEARVRLIYTMDETAARAAHEQIRAGLDFATVADRFNPPGVVPAGGDAGFLTAGTLIPPLDRYAREAPIGGLIGPVEASGQGWFLMRVEARRPRVQPPLDSQRVMLTAMLKQRKQRVTALRAIDALKTANDLQVVEDAPQTMMLKLSPPAAAGLQPPRPVLTAADRAIVLARYRGGAYTLADALEDIETSLAQPPNFAMLPVVRRWIESQALQRLAVVEARRRLIQEEPEVRRTMRERLNNYLLEGIYTREVIQRIEVSEQDLRAAHERIARNMIRLDQARVLTVTLPDSATAGQIAAHVTQAGSLREAAAAIAPAARIRSETIRYPSQDPFWGPLQGRFMGMAPGEHAGPYPAPGGWVVLELQAKDQRAQTFEDLPPVVLQQLHSDVIQTKREERLTELTDSLRRAIPVAVFRERLARVPWPPPALPPAA
jgi:peptidyl-prolyl cis-trans isomerase C